VFAVASGLKGHDVHLSGAVFVPVSVPGADAVLAARMTNVPGSPVGTWYLAKPVNEPSTIGAVNAAARSHSYWGAAAQPGSAAARTRDTVLASSQEAAAIRCVTRPGSSTIAPGPSSDRSQCRLRSDRDVIYWVKTPGQPATAERLGDVDGVTCRHTYSLAELRATSPRGPGFCTAVAFAADNPGYDVELTPAPRPRKILNEVGGSC